MTDTTDRSKFRAIPPVDELLGHETIAARRAAAPNFPWTRLFRSVIDDFRGKSKPPAGVDLADRESVRSWLIGEAAARFDELRVGGQRRVLNGTGVLLHTNLGRAATGDGVGESAREALTHYVNLEIDLESGARGHRSETLNALIELKTGGEASVVVNNNAAAVYLVVNSYSPPGRVIVSRGELVEIGGSFRLPEILRHASAGVIEVGTTNRTYARDYFNVAKPNDLILKVHKSNYSIEGFAHEASYGELVDVAAQKGCFLAYDLGSGAMFDFRAAGIGEESRVDEILASGVDCVTMSGDKLLGGVQAGIIVGKKDFVERLKQNPLRRAVRIDKVSIAALQDVLRRYLFDADTTAAVPFLEQVLTPVESIRNRAAGIVEDLAGPAGLSRGAIEILVVDDDAAVGGGSFSSQVVPSAAVCIRCAGEKNAVELAREMRLHSLPIVARVRGNEVRINMRSILAREDRELGAVLKDILTAAHGDSNGPGTGRG